MKRALFAVALLLAATAATAQVYVTAGPAHVSGQESHDNPALAVGYAFSPHFAIEAGWIDKGMMTNDAGIVSRTPLGGNVERVNSVATREEFGAKRLTARLTMPINDHFSVFGMASAYRVNTRRFDTFVSSDIKEGAQPVLLSSTVVRTAADRTETVPSFGLGARITMDSFFSLFASVERVNLKDGMLRDTDHVRITTIGAQWRF